MMFHWEINTKVLSCLSENGFDVQQSKKAFSIRPNYCNKGSIDLLNYIHTKVSVYYGRRMSKWGINTR